MIVPFKGRTLDPRKPVQVYRNLNAKTAKWSVRQGGLVVGHCREVSLKECRFVVQFGGHGRYLRTGKRNVHAYVQGTVTEEVINRGRDIEYDLPAGTFRVTRAIFPMYQVHDAEEVRFWDGGVYANGLGFKL